MSVKPTEGIQYLKLDIQAMQEDFFCDSAFIGLSSALSPHRLCWLLNKQFDIHFIRKPEMDICILKKEKIAGRPGDTGAREYWHAVFEYLVPLSETRYLLYKLRHDKSFLLPEIKQIEYLWLIQSGTCEQAAASIVDQLNGIQEIQFPVLLQPYKLKNLQNLLL